MKRKLPKTILFLLFILMGCDTIFNQPGIKIFKPAHIWPDMNNVHINAHGGGIIKVKSKYYWFGEHKIEGRKGNKAQVGVHCYSSSDLYNWKDEGIALKVVENDTTHMISKGCILERPKVVYNKKNNNYVMWFHLELLNQKYSSAMTGVATSKNVTGPYKFLNAYRPNSNTWPVNYPDSLKNKKYNYNELKPWTGPWIQAVKEGMLLQRDFYKGQMSRDMTIFVDDDNKAYHIHAAEENLTLHISLLTDDFLRFTDVYYRVMPAGHNEAPAIFKKENKYYMITSGCTGWTPNAARLLSANSINGKWTYHGNPCIGTNSDLTFRSQSTFILSLDKNKFIFMADRWKPKNPIEGTYVWLPINFDKNGLPYLEWHDEWNLNDL